MTSAALQCLPDANSYIGAQESLTKLNHLIGSPFFSFCGKGAQGKVSVLKGLVNSIFKESRPVLDRSDSSEFARKFTGRLAFFARATLKDGEVERTVYGKQAVDHLFKKVEGDIAQTKDFSLQTLQSIGRFHWLLDDKQAESLKGWTQQLIGGEDRSGAADTMNEKDKKSHEKKRRTKADAAALVDALF